MALFLGVDGGQSSTAALIGDENGRVIGSGEGGPCNHVGAGEGRAKLERAVRECVAAACAKAHLDSGCVRFQAACFGMSGGAADKRAVLAEIIPTDNLFVTHDALIALSGATGGSPGIIVIAGTGSMAFGRGASGVTARSGGWGYLFGDEGGGFDIVRQALRAALREHEGWGPGSALTATLLRVTGAADADQVLHRFYTDEWPRSRVAALAKLVDELAVDGDPVARDILFNAAQQLAMLATSVRKRLFQREACGVFYTGGVFHSRLVLERFRQLVELEEGSRCAPPRYPPAVGALIEAYRAAGVQPELSNI